MSPSLKHILHARGVEGAAPPARAAKTIKIGENLPRAASRSAQNLPRGGQEAARSQSRGVPAPAFEHLKRRVKKREFEERQKRQTS